MAEETVLMCRFIEPARVSLKGGSFETGLQCNLGCFDWFSISIVSVNVGRFIPNGLENKTGSFRNDDRSSKSRN